MNGSLAKTDPEQDIGSGNVNARMQKKTQLILVGAFTNIYINHHEVYARRPQRQIRRSKRTFKKADTVYKYLPKRGVLRGAQQLPKLIYCVMHRTLKSS
jgi:hypothetical protein